MIWTSLFRVEHETLTQSINRVTKFLKKWQLFFLPTFIVTFDMLARNFSVHVACVCVFCSWEWRQIDDITTVCNGVTQWLGRYVAVSCGPYLSRCRVQCDVGQPMMSHGGYITMTSTYLPTGFCLPFVVCYSFTSISSIVFNMACTCCTCKSLHKRRLCDQDCWHSDLSVNVASSCTKPTSVMCWLSPRWFKAP